MGYECNYSGEIRIEPPIPADEVTSAGFPEPGVFGDKDVAVKVLEVPVDGVPGAYRRLAVAIVPCMSYYTAYNMSDHIAEIASRWGAGRTFTGFIHGADPHSGDGDQWRYVVRDGAVVETRPQVIWPGGED